RDRFVGPRRAAVIGDTEECLVHGVAVGVARRDEALVSPELTGRGTGRVVVVDDDVAQLVEAGLVVAVRDDARLLDEGVPAVAAGGAEAGGRVGLAVIGELACRGGGRAADLRATPELAAAAETTLGAERDQVVLAHVDRRLAGVVAAAAGRANRLGLQLPDIE